MSATTRSEQSVEFVLIAEAGILAAQAVLLCESIRRFAGAWSRSPITVISPRHDRRPSSSVARELEKLDAEYLPIEIDSCCPEYGTSYRVHAAAFVERRPGPPLIAQLDSDTVFVGEPDLILTDHQAAARPVDVKGMCTSRQGDRFDAYWRALCALAGIQLEQLPMIETTVDRQAVRASYNGGLLVAERAAGIFSRTEDIFRRLVAARLMPWGADGPAIMTGTGLLRGAATAYWGSSQAAFSLAVAAGGHALSPLPPTHNFPLHLLHRFSHAIASPLVHLHYHGLFASPSESLDQALGTELDLPAAVREWLAARLPLAG